jgi:hypothetical protein
MTTRTTTWSRSRHTPGIRTSTFHTGSDHGAHRRHRPGQSVDG